MVCSNCAGIGHGSVRFLKNTLERKVVFVGKRQNVGYLLLGFLSRVGTTDPATVRDIQRFSRGRPRSDAEQDR
jgi:hypothetical protein